MTPSAAVGQASFDALWWLCLVIVIGLFIGVAWFLYWFGKLPGETAHARGRGHHSLRLARTSIPPALADCVGLGLSHPGGS